MIGTLNSDLEQIDRTTKKVKKLFGCKKDILWGFNTRFCSTVAQAKITPENDLVIEYSSRFWQILTFAQKAEVITHEVCHITAYAESGVLGHNKTWKIHMRKCGFEPLTELNVCLPYYLRPFAHVSVGFCECGGYPLTVRTRNLALRKKLKCKDCKKKVELIA